MSEERATTIFDADNTKLLAAAREVDAAIEGLGGSAKAAAAASVTGSAKVAEAAAKSSAAVQKVTSNFAATGQAARLAADQVQGIIGKASGYLGVAGLILGMTTAIVTATVEWYQAQEAVEKKIAATEKARRSILMQEEMITEQGNEDREARKFQGRVKREEALDRVANGARERKAVGLQREAELLERSKGEQSKINALLIESLETRKSISGLTQRETYDLQHQINLIKAGEVGAKRERVRSGPKREIADNTFAVAEPFEDLGEGIAAREQAVNARRLSAIEAERAALAEVEAFRFESAIALLETSEGNGAQIHALNMSAIEAERAAADAALEARENALRSDGTGDALDRLAREDELKQVVHERDMNRLEADLSMRQAVAEESKRIADEQQAELERQLSTISEVTSAVEGVASNLAGKLGEFASMRMEAEAAELEQYTAGLESRGRLQAAALDREIAQARGNAGRLAKLQEQKRKLEESTGKAIEKAKADHAAKADKIERIQKGTSMLLTGAQEVVETAAAYPNPVSMAAHAVAAALAFGFGAAVLAGGTPGAGGGGGAASMGGGSSSGGSVEFGEAAKTPGSLGTSAGASPKLAQTGNAAGGVVYNGPVNYYANGSIDRAAAESYALESGKAARSREGAGRT